MTFGQWSPLSSRWLKTPAANPAPSRQCISLGAQDRLLWTIPCESVPLPNSSMISKLLLVARFNATDICCRSIMKALWFWSGQSQSSPSTASKLTLDTLSLVATRVMILSVSPISALVAGTKLPMCAMNTIMATCLR